MNIKYCKITAVVLSDSSDMTKYIRTIHFETKWKSADTFLPAPPSHSLFSNLLHYRTHPFTVILFRLWTLPHQLTSSLPSTVRFPPQATLHHNSLFLHHKTVAFSVLPPHSYFSFRPPPPSPPATADRRQVKTLYINRISFKNLHVSRYFYRKYYIAH